MTEPMRIDRDVFLAAVRTLGEVVEARNTIPILSHLLIEARGEHWDVTASDLDLQATTRIAGKGEGQFTCDAAKLTAAVDSLRPGHIDAVVADGRLKLSQGKARRSMFVLPVEDYPRLPSEAMDVQFDMPATDLCGLLDAAHVAQSAEDKVRAYLCGVNLHRHEDKLVAAASDGVRAIMAQIKVPAGGEDMPAITLPRKLVGLLRRQLAKLEKGDVVSFGASALKARFVMGDTVLVAKLIEGNFPDLRRIFPTDNKRKLTVQGAELVRAVNSAAAMLEAIQDGTAKSKKVAFILSAEGCELQAGRFDGESVEPLEGDFDGGEAGPLRVGMNALYAAPVAAAFGESASIDLMFSDERSPVLFRSAQVPGISGVVMPVTL